MDTVQTGSPMSPVSSLLNTATVYKQRLREINELKQLLETTGKDCDYYQDLSSKLQTELANANETIARLERNVRNLKEVNEELSSTNDELKHFQSENSELKVRIEKLQNQLDLSVSTINRLKFDLEDSFNRLEDLEKEKQGVYSVLENVRSQLRDEQQMHEFAREKLSNMENQVSSSELRWQTKFNELQDEILTLKNNSRIILLEKEEECRKELETAALIKANSSAQIKKLENNFCQLETENKQLHKQIESINRLKTNYCLRIDKLEKELREKNCVLESKKEDKLLIDELKSRISSMEIELLRKENTSMNLENEISELKKNLNLKNSKYLELQQQFDEVSKKLMKAEEAIEERNDANREKQRLQELIERNKRQPPHLRDHYTIEMNDSKAQSKFSPTNYRKSSKRF